MIGTSTAVTGPTCAVDGCDRPHEARRLCAPHYQRWRLHGDPLGHIPINQTASGAVLCSCSTPDPRAYGECMTCRLVIPELLAPSVRAQLDPAALPARTAEGAERIRRVDPYIEAVAS